MFEKNQEYPLAPANGHHRSDEEAAPPSSKELKGKKRIKCAVYVAVLAVVQAGIILLLALTVLKIRTPKLRLGTLTIESMQTETSGLPSFNMRFNAQVKVKNTNFGHYKFDAGNVTFLYQGVTIGQAMVPKARAKARSTKKVDVGVELNSASLPSTENLGSELGSNVLTLNSQAKLSGEVELLKVIKKNKSAQMNCTITFNVSTKMLQNLSCK
ncbi:hypothetical protein P3X46_034439 [Hevea brasiliensis]|uniref:Late embryogenesis abundant protein LEA-2 subgroup domain-containing protein n=1 Tax=Hevea brasiliensis TaxID=3981 RepID=A0ABQ9KB25_HEVBR|nr:late embryogenesis abundant protein At1g64065-like [Hevea brasiliensis]KAJ9128824.1 hypothetical protein P3X46_034439 [Hevea brasiliensis]